MFIDTFVAPGSDGLLRAPQGLRFGPDGHLYVSSYVTDNILKYHGITGEFLGELVPPNSEGLRDPWDMAFDSDGHLFVSSTATNRILNYHGITGEFLGSLQSGELRSPRGLGFGGDGYLYVVNRGRPQILRFNGTTGDFLDVFIHDGRLGGAEGLSFGPDGHLYVSSSFDQILRYHGETGEFLDIFVPTGSGGLDSPAYLAFQTYSPEPSSLLSLTIEKAGDGSGTITSSPAGIHCGEDCSHGYAEGMTVTLTATPEADSSFTSWQGTDCADVSPCTVVMDREPIITATFRQDVSFLVSDADTDSISRYNSQTGAFISLFVPSRSGGLITPKGLTFGPDGNLYTITHSVLRFDGQTGEFIDVFVASGSGGLMTPSGLAFGPNDILYISSRTTNSILRFDGQTGAFIDVFVLEGIVSPEALTFGPDGSLCIASTGTDSVLCVSDQATNVIPSGSGGLNAPLGLTFGPDDNLYVSSATSDHILYFDGQTLDFLGEFVVDSGSGDEYARQALAFGPHGDLYVVSHFTDMIIKYNGQTGEFIDAFPTPGGPNGLAFEINAQPSRQFTLTVLKMGDGNGTVSSSPVGIDCGDDCQHNFNESTEVVLMAMPDSLSDFTGWQGGGCSGTEPCTVTITQALTVTAVFSVVPSQQFQLTIDKQGSGSGTVTSTPEGIHCGDECQHHFDENTELVLTAEPNSGSNFIGWQGAECSGIGACHVTIKQDLTVTAVFSSIPQFQLTIDKQGNGSCTVTSSPMGVDCGNICEYDFHENTQVMLTAQADPGSTFTGWQGAGCSGTEACTVNMTQDLNVVATCSLTQFQLTIDKQGNGTVTSNPAGIDCGNVCEHDFHENTQVELTALPDSGFIFAGWQGGGCSGNTPCRITMIQDLTVTAVFSQSPQLQLIVRKQGSGDGTVTSMPVGIDCGADCQHNFSENTVVFLEALPTSGSTFTGWQGGGCSGITQCMITLTEPITTVIATFTQNNPDGGETPPVE